MTRTAISRATLSDLDVVKALLEREHLPLAGLEDHFDHAFVARAGGRVVGCAALELYADGALLRSVAVAAEHRGAGIGADLTREAIRAAGERRVPAVYLLTTTAEHFFPRFGFEVVDRADVPPGVRSSAEFSYACPSDAIVMRTFLTSTT